MQNIYHGNCVYDLMVDQESHMNHLTAHRNRQKFKVRSHTIFDMRYLRLNIKPPDRYRLVMLKRPLGPVDTTQSPRIDLSKEM